MMTTRARKLEAKQEQTITTTSTTTWKTVDLLVISNVKEWNIDESFSLSNYYFVLDCGSFYFDLQMMLEIIIHSTHTYSAYVSAHFWFYDLSAGRCNQMVHCTEFDTDARRSHSDIKLNGNGEATYWNVIHINGSIIRWRIAYGYKCRNIWMNGACTHDPHKLKLAWSVDTFISHRHDEHLWQ